MEAGKGRGREGERGRRGREGRGGLVRRRRAYQWKVT